MRSNHIEVTLTADVEYGFTSEMGQRMTGTLPKGLKLLLPVQWVYQTGLTVKGTVNDLEREKEAREK